MADNPHDGATIIASIRADIDEAERIKLRDQFAMAALPMTWSDPRTNYDDEEMAELAYRVADAMLAERERTK